MKRQRNIKGGKANYRELAECKLLRSSRRNSQVKSKAVDLYPIQVVGSKDHGNQVKVHYIGYSDTFDERKDVSEIEDIHTHAPYSLYQDLSIRIKRSLTCARGSPDIKIVMPFDALTFNGGLKSVGMRSKRIGGIQDCKIKDLNIFLGCNWHVREININS